jgi:4-hydroxythreonine-4-phosphate dehydrogenase
MTHCESLLITMGDAVGIGPEIIAKAAATGQLHGCVVVGDPAVLRRAIHACGLSLAVQEIQQVNDPAGLDAAVLPVYKPTQLVPELAELPWGQVDARSGRAAAQCIEAAVGLVRQGQGAGLVTAPLHKEALSAAGIGYPGHTEMLQALAAEAGKPPPPVRMMLANDALRVVLVTIHLSLRQAIDTLSEQGVLETLRIAHAAASAWGQPSPRIAVAGLNPHAGEGGLFGDEEHRIIAPAIARARALGIDALGPYAPDTVFMRARNAPGHPGEFDLVVSMVHDHGLIAVKYLGVADGVNVTLGLPFVRTSPDHGTAFDIAGQGVADPSSLMAAVHMARRLCVAQGLPG